MHLKIQAASAATTQHASAHTRKANFGSLVSAIRHGDLATAKTAFEALQSRESGRFRADSKGDFAAIGEAIASGDPAAAKAALKTFQQAKTVAAPAVVAPADAAVTAPALPAAASEPTLNPTVDLLV